MDLDVYSVVFYKITKSIRHCIASVPTLDLANSHRDTATDRLGNGRQRTHTLQAARVLEGTKRQAQRPTVPRALWLENQAPPAHLLYPALRETIDNL